MPVEINVSRADKFKGITIGENSLFLRVSKFVHNWKFRLEDLYRPASLTTSEITLESPEKLHLSPKAKFIRDSLKKRLGKSASADLDRIILTIQDNDDFFEEEIEEPTTDEPKYIDPRVREEAMELLRDPAFFYKLGTIMERGFYIKKINKIRFVVGEDRNKRLVPLLNGASVVLDLTSLIRLLGKIGTGKDAIIRMSLTLSDQALNYIERGYMTTGAFRYSEKIKNCDIIYLPDSPEMQGDMGRQMRLNRSDDGGLSWEYSAKNPETNQMETVEGHIPVKHIITSSNAIRGDQALESGAFTLETNSDAELTRVVQHEKLKLRADKRPHISDNELALWKTVFQIALKENIPEKISIPYADQLMYLFSKSDTKQRRSPDKLCDLIEAITFWRRFIKPEETATVADFTDLYIALQLGFDMLMKTIAPLDREQMNLLKILDGVDTTFEYATVKYVCLYVKQAHNTVYKKLEYLVDKGYLTKGKIGTQNTYTPIYTKYDETDPDYLLSTLNTNKDGVIRLLEPLFTPDQNSSTLMENQTHRGVNPLNGDKIILGWVEGELLETVIEEGGGGVYVSVPPSELKSSNPPDRTPSESEKEDDSPLFRPNKSENPYGEDVIPIPLTEENEEDPN